MEWRMHKPGMAVPPGYRVIKLRTPAAHQSLSATRGDLVQVPEGEAEAYVDGNQAVRADPTESDPEVAELRARLADLESRSPAREAVHGDLGFDPPAKKAPARKGGSRPKPKSTRKR